MKSDKSALTNYFVIKLGALDGLSNQTGSKNDDGKYD
jgi:hypothetical protein